MEDFEFVFLGWGIAIIAGFIVRAVLNARDYKTGRKRRPFYCGY